MKTSLIFLTTTLFCLSVSLAQQQPFPASYLLDGYLLQEDTVYLLPLQDTLDRIMGDIYHFEEQRALDHETYVAADHFVCGNGLLYVIGAAYRFRARKKRLVLQVDGGWGAGSTFAYKARYQVTPLADGRVRLVREKVKRYDVRSDFPEVIRQKASRQATDSVPALPVQERTPTGLEASVY